MPTHEAEQVIADITSYVRDSASSWGLSVAVLSQAPEIVTRPWSFMLRYPVVKSMSGTRAVLVKVARHQDMDIARSVNEKALLERTEREFGMLSSIADVFQTKNGSSEFCFVRPLEALPQWNAIVMEELKSRTLKTYILRPRMILGLKRDWAPIERFLEQAARWLREYHDGMGNVEELSLAQAGLEDRVAQIFKRLSAHVPKHILEPVKMQLEEQHANMAGCKIAVGLLHNDFHCGNILVTPEGRVGALDADIACGPLYQDVAKFYADLRTRAVQVLTRGGFIRPPQLKRCYRAIIQGYFGTAMVDKELLRYFVSVAILEKWMMAEEPLIQLSGIKSLLIRLLTRWRRIYFLKLLREPME